MAESPNTMMLVLRLGLSLGLVLALVGVVTWALKRRGLLRPGGSKSSTGRLEVLDRKTLSKHASLVVARVGGVAVLVGVTEQGVSLISEAPGIDAAWSVEEPVARVEPAASLDAAALAPLLPPADYDTPADTAATDAAPQGDTPTAAPVVAESVVDLERLMQLPSAAAHTVSPETVSTVSPETAHTVSPETVETTSEARRTGLRADAAAATATTSGMSFVEALRELTVRRS